MKKYLLWITPLVLVGVLISYKTLLSQPNVLNYSEQGGARWVIGGSADVASGGEIDVETGGALKIAGTAITSTAAELNILDGVTATAAQLNYVTSIPGTASASKAVVLDANLHTDAVRTTALHLGATGATTQVTASATELNLLDDVTAIKRVVRSPWTYVTGGSSAAPVVIGSLPANHLVTRNWIHVTDQLVSAANGEIEITCGGNTLHTAADITGVSTGALRSGDVTGNGVTGAYAEAAACDITATVTVSDISAGTFVHYLEYVVTN